MNNVSVEHNIRYRSEGAPGWKSVIWLRKWRGIHWHLTQQADGTVSIDHYRP